MPPLIPIIVAIILPSVSTAAVWGLVITTLVSYLLEPSKSDAPSQLSDGIGQEYNGTTEPRRIIYGQTLVSGMNVIPPWCHGSKNEMLDQVLVLAGHPVDAITDIYANQTKILSANITAISGSQNDGKVTSGSFANKLWVRRYVGAAAGALDYILNQAWGSYWDANHLGKSVAYLAIQYQYDTTVYSGGKPDIRALVRGKKVYDPRLDSTNGGSGAQRYTDSTTWTYSSNPALAITDYLMDSVLGLGEAPTRIDWVSTTAAANCCDETVTIPSSTQKRYTVGCVLDCTDNYEDNLKTLASAMQGAVLYSAGKWVLLPGKYSSPVFTVGDDDVIGSMAFRTKLPFANRYNAVRGQFYDPANLYQPVEYPAIRVGADESADGEGPVWRELQQPTCTDQYEAQRNAIILQRKSRRTKTWVFQAGYGLYGIRPGEFGTFSNTELGISSQVVRCSGWKLNPQTMQVELALEEVDSADWNDPAVGVYQTTTALSLPAPGVFTSDPTTGFSATGGAGGITFAWSLPTGIWYNNLTVELLEAATNNIAGATVVWAGVNTGAFLQKGDTTTRYYWTRIRNLAGNTVSATTPAGATSGLSAAATSLVGPAGVSGLSAEHSRASILLVCDPNGVVTQGLAAYGQMYVFSGATDVTASSTYSLASNPDSVGYTLNGSTGAWSITTVSQDISTITFRANYGGATLDRAVTIIKTKFGAIPWTPVMTSASGGMYQVSPGTFQKYGGAGNWDSQVYSVEKYGQCFMSFKVATLNQAVMVGLNSDPSADAGYSGLDHCWYQNGSNTWDIYESGSSPYSGPSINVGDVASITYDGFVVRYYLNGLVKYSTINVGKTFALDSSFWTVNSYISNLSFGPMAGLIPDGKNLLDTTVWRVGTTGSQGNFPDQYSDQGSHNFSAIVLGTGGSEPVGPYGSPEALWKGYGSTSSYSGGGWRDTADIKIIDPKKTYRSCVWFRYHTANTGSFYHGCDEGGQTLNIDGSANNNPYFFGSSASVFTLDRWYLSVGYVHGSDYDTTQRYVGAVYDGVTGLRVQSNTDFKLPAGATTQTHRTFQYYATNSSTVTYFCRPRFEVVDGSEPSILALLKLVGTDWISSDATSQISSVTDAALDQIAQGTTRTNAVAVTNTINTTGSPVSIDAIGSCVIQKVLNLTAWSLSITVFRGGASIGAATIAFDQSTISLISYQFTVQAVGISFTDTPSAGSQTYTIVYSAAATGPANSYLGVVVGDLTLKIREYKR